jgi:hypothetical protein
MNAGIGLRKWWTVFVLVTASVACTTNDTGSLEGEYLIVRECKGGVDVEFEPYTLDANFFGVEKLGNALFIRMQNGGKPLHRVDALVVNIVDTRWLAARIGVWLPLDNPNVQVTLHVLGQCPDTTQAMSAHGGEIRFSDFGDDVGDQVTGEFRFDLLDDRSGDLVGIHFAGVFEFVIRAGPPHQSFSGAFF